ncbi:hypothetical protein MKZ38_003288 [Zalerion maritima]|uniref:Uncharacterized protein n=1 Tax=Zalerion maritima TaxID=339359 RepID=A0AAD5WQR8_9PEZI|nr:hypothetical protein MKZ38_003288 [Zalerion maritima]
MNAPPVESSSLSIRSPGAPPTAKMIASPQPTQLLSASKIQRIDVWRIEIGISDLMCVCSLSTAPSAISGPAKYLPLAASSPMTHSRPGTVLLASTNSAHSQPQRSPASSVYSSSDAYTSTQATSTLSSNSLRLLLDGKLDLCPQCGIQRTDPSCQSDSNDSILEGKPSQRCTAGAGSDKAKSKKLWAGVKKFARKCAGRGPNQETAAGETAAAKDKEAEEGNVSHEAFRSRSRSGGPGVTTPSPIDVPLASKKLGTATPQDANRPTVRKGVSQSFKRMSVHLGSPLQSSPPPDYSIAVASTSRATPAVGRPSADGGRSSGAMGAAAGTQMYSSLRYASADDERLMEILGTTKIANANAAAANPDPAVDIDELIKEDNETPEARRLRERAERLEKGRRLLSRSGPGTAPPKRPISFAGVAAVSMGARF